MLLFRFLPTCIANVSYWVLCFLELRYSKVKTKNLSKHSFRGVTHPNWNCYYPLQCTWYNIIWLYAQYHIYRVKHVTVILTWITKLDDDYCKPKLSEYASPLWLISWKIPLYSHHWPKVNVIALNVSHLNHCYALMDMTWVQLCRPLCLPS